jgi:glutathione S-transferase
LQLLELPFERIEAGRDFGVVNTAHYLALNPNALVPTLQDGALTLWESNVIVRYLCAKAGKLYPQDLTQRFDAERWMDWQQTTFNPASRGAFWGWIRTPVEKRDEAAIADSLKRTQACLALMDALLARQAFMAGETLSMADIPLACELHRWTFLPHATDPLLGLPHVARWWAHMRALPAAAGVLDLPLS